MKKEETSKKILYVLCMLIICILVCVILVRSVEYIVLNESAYKQAYKETVITSENIPIIKKNDESARYIRIPKSKDKASEINLEDDYMNSSIIVTLVGLKEQSITNEMIERYSNEILTKGPANSSEDDLVKNIEVTYKSNGNLYDASVTLSFDKIYAYSIYEKDEYIYIDLEAPKDAYDRILVLDAGHGGNDSGTYSTNQEYYEKNINLAIVLKLKELLDKEDIKVYYTRLEDEKVYLRPRVNLANTLEADLFVSVHCNGSTSQTANGSTVLYDELSSKEGFNSSALASNCLEQLVSKIKTVNRNIKKGNDIYIVGHSKVPVALIEVGFMSNSSDMAILKKQKQQQKIAEGIFNGIMLSFEQLEQ